jgi:hypothetical protein
MKNIHINNLYESMDFVKDLYSTKKSFNGFLNIINNKSYIDNNTNDYYFNSLSFRDKVEWQKGKPAEILALGCSHTFGVGVPQKYTWPSIVESITKKTVANLGICGASAEQMLESFLLYLDTVGNPTYVLACFPDYLRYSHVVDGTFYSINNKYVHNNKPFKTMSHIRSSDHYTGEIYIKDKIFKLPADPRYIIPTQESLSQYISSIYIIEKICKFLNIEFYWGTWSKETQDMFTNSFFLDKNFCLDIKHHVEKIQSDAMISDTKEFKHRLALSYCKSDHSINKEDLIKYKHNMWKLGSDQAHNGIHWHYHTAENFIEKILFKA